MNGKDPGIIDGDEMEAVLDTSWSGAVAPYANITLVVSASTYSTDGVFLSEEYIVDNNMADIMSESYGGCEAEATKAEAIQIETLAEEAAAQGITYVVASGDSGSAGCDYPGSPLAFGPLSVNVLASTPYTIAVGGTQFNENGKDSTYWKSKNSPWYESAISYIPEKVWNESCSLAQCGDNANLSAGGGGASTLFAKPFWQNGVPGIPSDGARHVPDVSLTAALHDPYLLCFHNACTPNSKGQIQFYLVGGTSASTPSFAGIIALLGFPADPYFGPRLGQIDYYLYQLAAAENLSQCNASGTRLPAATCVFNDVTVGNNAVPGEPGYGTAAAKYQATLGYDLATGLGSINVTNLYNQYQLANLCCQSSPLQISPPGGLLWQFQPVGAASSIQTISLSNIGSTSFGITQLKLIGKNSSDFVIISTTCGTTLTPGASCTVDAQFVPIATGTRGAALLIDYTGPGSPTTVGLTGTATGQINFTGQNANDIRVAGDFDGDGQLDFGVWRPSTGFWYIYLSGSPGSVTEEQWGLPGDIPVPADYDGDGLTDYAVWRPSTATWCILPSSTRIAYSVQWGAPGDIPITGDFDGDGIADLVVWRPSNGTWYFVLSRTGTVTSYQWGLPGDVPVPGDYDFSGKQEMAVWRPSDATWYIVPANNPAAPIVQQWGLPGDIPVPGDYDGDGGTDLAVWRPGDHNLYITFSGGEPPSRMQSVPPTDVLATNFPVGNQYDSVYFQIHGDFDGDGIPDFAVWDPATGSWYIIPTSNPTPIQQQWGDPGDVPVAGDYDGDGKTDLAVWRPSTGYWYIAPSSNPTVPIEAGWGVSGDIPLVGDFDGDGKTDLAVWRPSTAYWFIAPSRAGAAYAAHWGAIGDTPVIGDFDGDKRTDIAVCVPQTAPGTSFRAVPARLMRSSGVYSATSPRQPTSTGTAKPVSASGDLQPRPT